MLPSSRAPSRAPSGATWPSPSTDGWPDLSGRIVVDGNNVVGAAADGWWRDPPAAVNRLLERLHCYARSTGEDIVLVLDVPQADLPEGDRGGGVEVRYAVRKGRDAADDRIRGLVQRGDTVVTSDRALAADLRPAGAAVLGSGAFLSRLQQTGC